MELFKSRTRVAYTNAVGDKVYPVIVDIKRGIKSTEEIQFMSSDINTGILSVAFIQGNDNYNVSGAEVVCSVMRPDASTLELPCEVVGENIVEVPLGINGTSQDGVYSFDFKVIKGENKVVGTSIMNYSVSLSISNDMVVEEDDRLPVLTMLMTQLTDLKGEARETINQANAATVASKEATAKAIVATNNANAVSERVSQEASEVISRVDNKVNEVENRFNALTSSQQQDAEVIDARDGETSLKARLDRDIEKAKQVYVNVEGNHISTDSSDGYLKDVEILGNTIQDALNLADIRSVGDKVEGQELYEIPVLSCGKNLFDGELEPGTYHYNNGVKVPSTTEIRSVHKIKVNPNSNYLISSNKPTENIGVYYYDSKENFIKSDYDGGQKIVTTEDTHFIAFRFTNLDLDRTVQLEEGTVVTPYEPYIEDKLTILSPVQLEKVGDVADRLICKDGVWGVEKNVKLNDFPHRLAWNIGEQLEKTTRYHVQLLDLKNASDIRPSDASILAPIICNKFPTYKVQDMVGTDVESVGLSSSAFSIRLNNDKLTSLNSDGVNNWIAENGLKILYQTTQPQFIPLPHDQQVKLRTFANKTNISFLTEVEGTIKAQVPKSLGATVNTHTEQISNLNKELDRVKKLEESTVSTVTTESDFTTVEATSNGYFEDVKLEGKTLVVNDSNEIVEPGTEGATLKSVGQDVDEIIVSSVNENLFDGELEVGAIKGTNGEDDNNNTASWRRSSFIKVNSSNMVHILKQTGSKFIFQYDENKTFIKYTDTANDIYSIIVNSNCKYIRLTYNFIPSENIYLGSNSNITEHIPHQSDKKRLLFYNNETQTWEKPILREWDSIEKHSDGKYYYHKRCEEVVFDGSDDEGWWDTSAYGSESDDTKEFRGKSKGAVRSLLVQNLLSDKFNFTKDIWINFKEGICVAENDSIDIRISKSKLSTQDAQGFKQWLQANNVTVVYQLAEEKVYECTNIDLITYANETNYIVESGAIAPKSILKVHNNISNVVKILQEKVSLLESNVKASQEVQDMMILETDMRMLDIELALMEFAPMKLNLGGSNMLRSATYFNFLKNHIINETYEKEYLENVMNKYLATGRINQDEYNELYKMLYPPVYDIELPIEL